MAKRRLALLLSILALVAMACGTADVVVTGPSVEPAAGSAGPVPAGVVDDANPSEEAELELPEDFSFAPSGGDEESAPEPTGDETEPPVDEAAAGSGGDDAAPTTLAFVRQAAGETAASETYRFEVFFEMYVADGATVFDVAPVDPLTTGAVAGDRSWVRTDMATIFDAVFAAAGGGTARELLGSDLAMEVIADGADGLYLRAPLFASMAELGVLPGAEDLVALGDGWGFIDLASATGLTAAELGALTGAQTGASADELLSMIDAIGGAVTELGTADVRGVTTTQYRADVSLASVMDAQGLTAEDLAGIATGSLDALSIPFDVFVDEDSRVRRMSVVIDTAVLADLIGEAPAGAEARIATTIDLYDFGADIEIVDPATLNAVDVTDAFIALSAG